MTLLIRRISTRFPTNTRYTSVYIKSFHFILNGIRVNSSDAYERRAAIDAMVERLPTKLKAQDSSPTEVISQLPKFGFVSTCYSHQSLFVFTLL